MRDSIRFFRAFLVCLLASLTLGAPATAWRMHQENHLAAMDQQERLSETRTDAPGGKDLGCTHEEGDHGHLTGLSGGLVALVPEMDFEPPRLDAPALPRPAAMRLPPTSADPPLPRPPRFA